MILNRVNKGTWRKFVIVLVSTLKGYLQVDLMHKVNKGFSAYNGVLSQANRFTTEVSHRSLTATIFK